jgi:EAL domain-containing protein (putative c-di-GMP-specific phosphodiesterase class I)
VDAARRLAHAVGARTIAESVESPDTLERMRALGIDFAQGYLIHAPEPYPALADRVGYPRAAHCAVIAA